MADPDDLALALGPVASALESLEIRYYIGGSVASSYHGAIRSTMDVDLACELTEQGISGMLARLNDAYYISELAIRDAVHRKSCFNAIHLATSFKVDFFISRNRPFDLYVLNRAKVVDLFSDGSLRVPVASIEDVIILKLEWYRQGGEVSERQWSDVSRLVSISFNVLDWEYLRSAAESLAIGDLLERLLGSH